MNRLLVPDFKNLESEEMIASFGLDIGKVEDIYGEYPKDKFYDLPTKKFVPIDGGALAYHEVLPSGDYDESKVLVRILEAGNDLAPHQYASILLVAEYLGIKAIVIPHNRFQLSRSERQDVRKGDLSDNVAKKLGRLITNLTNDSDRVSIDGASMGAQLAIPTASALATERSIHTVTALENPNTRRNANRLKTVKDFSAADNDDWVQAEHDAGWEGLSDIFSNDGYVKRSNGDFVKNFILSRELAMWLGAMSTNSLSDDVRDFGSLLRSESDRSSLVLARGAGSKMTDSTTLLDSIRNNILVSGPNALAALEIQPLEGREPRGHAITNNPLARLAHILIAQERSLS